MILSYKCQNLIVIFIQIYYIPLTEMEQSFQPLEDMIYNVDHKVDIFWQQRLLRKHKDLHEFKSRLLICLGYYHERDCDEIIEELRVKNVLQNFVDIE